MMTRTGGLVVAVLLAMPTWLARDARAQQTGGAEEVQNPPPEGTPSEAGTVRKQHEEEVVVTGSRIRRKDLTTPAPITVIGREQMQASGRASLADFLQTIPEQGNAINTAFNNGGDGSTRIDLRGLGTARTLVLLNGRRFVSGGNGANASVDLNSIPTASVERIEVLKDGASAIYGSDAIAGVVNIITRKRLDGSEATAYAGTTGHGDGTVYDIGVSTGASGERGSILFSGGFFKQFSISAGDRDFSRIPVAYDATGKASGHQGVYTIGSGTIPQGRIILNSKAIGKTVNNPNNDPGIALYNNLVTAFPKTGSFIHDSTAALGWRPYGGAFLAPDGDGFNFQPDNYLLTPSQRVQLFSIGDTKIGANTRAYFEGSYVNRRSDQQLAAEPLLTDLEGVTVTAGNFYNPFGVDIRAVRRRLNEFSNRRTSQDLDTFRVVGGFEGTVPVDLGPIKGWNWDTSLNYGRQVGTIVKSGNLKRPALASALGDSFLDNTGVARCGTAAAPIANCVPLNLFGGPGTITPDQTKNLTFTGTARGVNELLAAQANLSGELFRIAAERPVGLAIGYEYRLVQGENVPDPVTVAGETTGNKGEITRGRYHVNEAYAELSVPLVDNMLLAQAIELSGAIRAFNYNTFGSDYTYKFGGRWQLVRDFTIRGTYSTAFRAPSIGDLFFGQADSFPPNKDPCRGPSAGGATPPASCGAAANNGDDQSQLRTRVGGNPKLQPETAKTFTLGVVVEPRWVKNLSVTVDYYAIRVQNSISTIGGSVILGSCYPTDASVAPKYCQFVNRDPATQRITTIQNTNANVGEDWTSGVDFAVRYQIPVEGIGRFGFNFDGNLLQKFDRVLADGSVIRGKGTYDLGVYPDLKFIAGASYALGGFNAGLNAHLVSKFTECGTAAGDFSGSGLCYTNPGQSRLVQAYSTFDLYLAYSLKTSYGKTLFSLGMNNVFDKNPSSIYNGFLAASDPGTYDYIGRFVYARVGHSF